MSTRWGIKWHVGIMWKDCMPLLFLTRKEAREYIHDEYGYIKHRKDLRSPPHNWRLPRAIRVNVILEEVRRTK